MIYDKGSEPSLASSSMKYRKGLDSDMGGGDDKALYDEALAFIESSPSSVSNQVQVGHVLISLAGWHYFQDQ